MLYEVITTFYIVEDMPSFPGGNTALAGYIDSHLQYIKNTKYESNSILKKQVTDIIKSRNNFL